MQGELKLNYHFKSHQSYSHINRDSASPVVEQIIWHLQAIRYKTRRVIWKRILKEMLISQLDLQIYRSLQQVKNEKVAMSFFAVVLNKAETALNNYVYVIKTYCIKNFLRNLQQQFETRVSAQNRHICITHTQTNLKQI